MCDTCGCNREEAFHIHTGKQDCDGHGHHGTHSHRNEDGHVVVHTHVHPHGCDHEHRHAHESDLGHSHGGGESRTLDVHRSLLSANDRIAERNRGYFQAKKIRAINVLSSPGAGKTTLLERTLAQATDRKAMAVVVGDLETENDAVRLRGGGAEVVQVTTGTLCHLDAGMVSAAVREMELPENGILFIENVGNLVCPASFDLGESERVVLFSVTEGEDKPLKYPPIFKSANLVLLTKVDLAEAAGFDREAALRNVREVAPQARIIELSARNGKGMAEWFEYLSAPWPGGTAVRPILADAKPTRAEK